MKRPFTHHVTGFFNKNYDAIKLGLLVGLLVSNILLITKQSSTLREVLKVGDSIKEQIAADNAARDQTRKDNVERDESTQRYIACIARVLIENATLQINLRIQSLDQCVITNRAENPPDRSGAVTTPSSNPEVAVRQNPTTSNPPDPGTPTPNNPTPTPTVEADPVTLGDIIREVPQALTGILDGIGKQLK